MIAPAKALAAVLRVYQVTVSPLFPASCRFAPSCSEYARQAVLAQGAIRGGWLAALRLARCHPFTPGGYDPPPPRGA